MRLANVAAAIAVVFGVTAVPPVAAAVINGGFETGDFTGWHTTPASSGSDFGVLSDSTHAHSGLDSAAFAATGSEDDSIDQLLPTIPGQSYTIDFWLFKYPNNGNPANNDFTARWDGLPILSLASQDAFSYTEYTFSLLANGASTTLQFSGRDVPAGYLLDDVSVTLTVPEPSTLVLGLAGFAGLGLVTLRKKFRRS